MNSLSYVSDEYLLSQAGVNPDRAFLGNLCSRNHDWNKTGKSLRYVSDKGCAACRGIIRTGIRFVPDDEKGQQILIDAGIDPTKFILSSLCLHGHEWNNTGLSLRRRNRADAEWAKRHGSVLGKCLGCEKAKKEKNRKPKKTFSERFWEKVNIKSEDDCWDWQAALNPSGYGKFGVTNEDAEIFGLKGHTTIGSHRVSFYLANGFIDNDLMVLHSCDRRSCCNPSHLRQGDAKENGEDMVKRKRGTIGQTDNYLKLSDDDIREMRRLHKTGQWTYVALMERFDCSRTHVGEVVNYRARPNVPD